MASVFLGDLDDFIAPGQACVNPLFTLPDAKPTPAAAAVAAEGTAENTGGQPAGDATLRLVLEDDGGPLDNIQVRGGGQEFRSFSWLGESNCY